MKNIQIPDSVKEKYEGRGVNVDVNDRWEKGVPHHPKSIELMDALQDIDFYYCNDHHCFKTGGDGDNGEALMYLMDIFFDSQDALSKKYISGRANALQDLQQLMKKMGKVADEWGKKIKTEEVVKRDLNKYITVRTLIPLIQDVEMSLSRIKHSYAYGFNRNNFINGVDKLHESIDNLKDLLKSSPEAVEAWEKENTNK